MSEWKYDADGNSPGQTDQLTKADAMIGCALMMFVGALSLSITAKASSRRLFAHNSETLQQITDLVFITMFGVGLFVFGTGLIGLLYFGFVAEDPGDRDA